MRAPADPGSTCLHVSAKGQVAQPAWPCIMQNVILRKKVPSSELKLLLS